MANYCKLTGIDFDKGESSPIKWMCLNCKYCIDEQNGTYACKNEAVLNIAKEKIMAAVPEGYEIENISLKPMNLKNPTKKCSNYEVDMDVIHEEIKKNFYTITDVDE